MLERWVWIQKIWAQFLTLPLQVIGEEKGIGN